MGCQLDRERVAFICTGLISIFNPKSQIIEYCEDLWQQFTPALFQNTLILVGDNKRVECFDLCTKTRYALASMSTERTSFSVETLNDCVYAVGGYTNGAKTNTVERWDSTLDSWSFVAPMLKAKVNFCLASFGGKLFAIGGRTNKSVQCYDPVANEWTNCGRLLTARSNARAVTVKDKGIYVFGGYNTKLGTLKCIEMYNPETKTCTKVGELVIKRSCMGAYLFQKKIYIFGGCDEECEWLQSMEEFDPETNECKVINCNYIEYEMDLYGFAYKQY